MPPIEKIWGSVFSPVAVRRKEDAPGGQDESKDESKGQRRDPDRRREGTPEEERRPPTDRPAVERAVTELKSIDPFTQAGMRVEMVEDKEGLKVKLTQSNGAVVRTMSAEDFLKLRDSSGTEKKPVGKILDQKF